MWNLTISPAFSLSRTRLPCCKTSFEKTPSSVRNWRRARVGATCESRSAAAMRKASHPRCPSRKASSRARLSRTFAVATLAWRCTEIAWYCCRRKAVEQPETIYQEAQLALQRGDFKAAEQRAAYGHTLARGSKEWE